MKKYEINDIELELKDLLSKNYTAPFLFVGSGLSIRYLGLDNWYDLLDKFSINLNKPFRYYYSNTNEQLDLTASNMVEDFKEIWWSNEQYRTQREKFNDKVSRVEDPLKIAISEYISQSKKTNKEFQKEIDELKRMVIDGIITTNYDTLMEDLFDKFKVYIGQDELFFNTQHAVAEIYKIHGCCTLPSSLVLTASDYKDFNSKNAYLASKLLTIFLEHPIIFLGYSITDKNIREILKSILFCIGKDKVNLLYDRFLFVKRAKSEDDLNISKNTLVFDDYSIPITEVQTTSFIPIYRATHTFQRKIPAQILRQCKEQMYEIIKTNNPQNRIHVTSFDEKVNLSNVEFVIGVGTINQHITQKGYSGLSRSDIFHEYFSEKPSYECNILITDTFPKLLKSMSHMPIFYFLNSIGIKSESDYKHMHCNLDKTIKLKKENYYPKQYMKHKDKISTKTLDTLINEYDINHVMLYFPFLSHDVIKSNQARLFLKENLNLINLENSSLSTYYIKAVCFYDRLIYGWFN